VHGDTDIALSKKTGRGFVFVRVGVREVRTGGCGAILGMTVSDLKGKAPPGYLPCRQNAIVLSTPRCFRASERVQSTISAVEDSADQGNGVLC